MTTTRLRFIYIARSLSLFLLTSFLTIEHRCCKSNSLTYLVHTRAYDYTRWMPIVRKKKLEMKIVAFPLQVCIVNYLLYI